MKITLFMAFFILSSLGLSSCTVKEEKGYELDQTTAQSTSGLSESIDNIQDSISTASSEEEVNFYSGKYELPLDGTTGFSAIVLELKEYLSWDSVSISIVNQATTFTILSEKDGWLNVKLANGEVGWLPGQHCFVNLPDIIPSIIYLNSNSNKSLFRSSKKSIPEVTEQKLYESKSFNNRFNRKEFVVPVLFPMAIKIMNAQKKAISENNTLIIYEGFRPWQVQKKISDSLQNLAQNDQEVLNGINQYPWSIDWFISTKVSNHQIGYAIDVSLGKVNEIEEVSVGDYFFKRPKSYAEYSMQSAMHELSMQSAIFSEPIPPLSLDWQQGTLVDTISPHTIKLQEYLTEAGLTPLASEWWHFNDLDTYRLLEGKFGSGDYFLNSLVSEVPK